MIGTQQEGRLESSAAGGPGKSLVIVSLAALVFALLVCLILFTGELILSFKAYQPAKGLMGSPWVGLENIKNLLNSVHFITVIKNTLIFNILFSIVYFTVAAAAGYIVTALPRRLREIVAVLCALPVFLPAEIYGSWLIHLLGPSAFVNPGAMRFLYPLLCAVKYAGISMMVTYILSELQADRDRLLPLKSAALFSLSSLAFAASGFFSMNNALSNPLVYQTMDMADNFYRSSFILNMDMGSGSVGVIQTLITIVSAAILFTPVRLLFSSTFKGAKIEPAREKTGGRLITSLAALAIFAAIYFLPYILKGRSFDTGLTGGSFSLGSAVFLYLLLSLVSALIATALASVMSGAFAGTGKTKLVAGILLVLITILTIRPVNYTNYLVIRGMGAVNTVFAIILASFFSAVAVWAMVALLHSEDRFSVKSVFQAATGVFLIQAAVNYGNIVPSLLYLHNPGLFSPILTFKELQMSVQTMGNAAEGTSAYGVLGLYGFVIALPALLLFLAVNVILPRRKLFAVIAAGIKG